MLCILSSTYCSFLLSFFSSTFLLPCCCWFRGLQLSRRCRLCIRALAAYLLGCKPGCDVGSVCGFLTMWGDRALHWASVIGLFLVDSCPLSLIEKYDLQNKQKTLIHRWLDRRGIVYKEIELYCLEEGSCWEYHKDCDCLESISYFLYLFIESDGLMVEWR